MLVSRRLACGLVLVVLLAGVLAACGGSPSTMEPAPSPSRSEPSPPGGASSPSPLAPSPDEEGEDTVLPSASPAPPPCPTDNTRSSWYYVPNASHRPPQVPATARRLLDEYGGRYLGDTTQKVVYLTFDEGYENGLTSQILDTLSATGVKAAFFVTGTYIRDNAELVRRMVEEGHVVANHTYDHPSLPSLARDHSAFTRQVEATERIYRRTTGRDIAPFLRPPAGEYSPLSLCLTERLGYASVFWSFAHRDWLVDDQPPVPVTLRRILDGSHNGAIYLLHAVSRSDTEALPEAIAGLRDRGYRFGALTDLP